MPGQHTAGDETTGAVESAVASGAVRRLGPLVSFCKTKPFRVLVFRRGSTGLASEIRVVP